MSTPMDIVNKELALQIEYENLVAELETSLKIAKAALHDQNTKATPLAMSVAEVTGFTLENGFKVNVKPFVEGSIDKTNPDPAFRDIEDRKEGSIIKWSVALQFGKDEEKKAQEAQALLTKGGFEPAISLGVHYQTLQAYLRRHYQDEGFPLQTLYNGSAGMRAYIQRPKR